MKQAEIIRCIECTAPLSIAAPWDHSGVQVASRREEIGHLAVCLDPTPDSVGRAIEAGAEMILAHHPLAMKPRFTDRLDAYRDVLSLLFRADVPLYSSHTSLDANPKGPVAWLARELGLKRPAPVVSAAEAVFEAPLPVLERTGSMRGLDGEWDCGFGVIGDVAPLSGEALGKALSPWLEGICTRLVGELPPAVRRIAICPGSGSDLADAAAALGADILITGDLKYHPSLEMPLPVLDVGHFSLEEEMMRRFAQELGEKLPDVKVTFLPAADPFRPFFATHRA